MNVPDSWYQLGLFDRDNNKHIGDIGIHFLNNMDEMEIGCTIAPNYWNKGYATESLQAVISFIFNILKKKRIIAYISIDNIQSRKLFERLGFQLVLQSNSEVIYQLT
jgi:RimJ/RimL family protein N-acetyltransferase